MHKQNRTTKFFNQIIKIIKQDIKNFGIITDKDGTLLLNEELKKALQKFKENDLGVNVYLIANSGRAVQDMINCLEQEEIPLSYFDYIIGDNGAMCIDVKTGQELYKDTIKKDIVKRVIDKFIELGGDLPDIRLSDGESIYAYPEEKVLAYYKDSKDISFREDIMNLEDIDITKLTLTGSHELIKDIDKFVRENVKGYKTHLGKTSFPIKSKNNYRVDFTRNAHKR